MERHINKKIYNFILKKRKKGKGKGNEMKHYTCMPNEKRKKNTWTGE